jgi:hypothetical protein
MEKKTGLNAAGYLSHHERKCKVDQKGADLESDKFLGHDLHATRKRRVTNTHPMLSPGWRLSSQNNWKELGTRDQISSVM